MSWRARLTRIFLWVAVLGWAILLGAKLFDLLVLAGAWSAAPPESLSLLPYGPRFPIDPGDFFEPLGLPMLVGVFGALISGWKTPPRYRVWLVVPAVMMLMIWTFTILWFWPHNRALWHVATGAPDAIRDRTEIIRMARQWVHYDWLRVTIGITAFVSTVRAISVPFPEPQNSAAVKPAPAK